nr:MAG TPA: hypothetical protein [Caudoviricetes sp.]
MSGGADVFARLRNYRLNLCENGSATFFPPPLTQTPKRFSHKRLNAQTSSLYNALIPIPQNSLNATFPKR